MVIAALSILSAIIIVIRKLFFPGIDAGWASVMVGIFFSLGVQLFFLGLVGEYVGRAYMHINNEPQYVVKNRYNIDETTEDRS